MEIEPENLERLISDDPTGNDWGIMELRNPEERSE